MPEKVLLPDVFDTFGNDRKVMAVRRGDSRPCQAGVLPVFRRLTFKRLVDFDSVDRWPSQITEKRISGPEVIQDIGDAYVFHYFTCGDHRVNICITSFPVDSSFIL